jgi:hypothetical protein
MRVLLKRFFVWLAKPEGFWIELAVVFALILTFAVCLFGWGAICFKFF